MLYGPPLTPVQARPNPAPTDTDTAPGSLAKRRSRLAAMTSWARDQSVVASARLGSPSAVISTALIPTVQSTGSRGWRGGPPLGPSSTLSENLTGARRAAATHSSLVNPRRLAAKLRAASALTEEVTYTLPWGPTQLSVYSVTATGAEEPVGVQVTVLTVT